MEVKTIGDGLIYAGAIAMALAAIGALLRFAVVKPIKAWIGEQIQPVANQVEPNADGDGSTTRNLVEKTADDMGQVLAELKLLSARTDENRDMAHAALTLAREANERIDRALAQGTFG